MADKITANPDGSLNVSDEPIIPFIEGDGTGVDIWPAAKHVLDAAAAKHGRPSPGRRCWPGRRRSTRPATGFRRPPSTRSAST